MICRTCGTDIADKALICYRCGTATTEAKFRPLSQGGARTPLLTAVLAIAIVAVAAVVAYRSGSSGPTGAAAWVLVAVAVAIVVMRAVLRRR